MEKETIYRYSKPIRRGHFDPMDFTVTYFRIYIGLAFLMFYYIYIAHVIYSYDTITHKTQPHVMHVAMYSINMHVFRSMSIYKLLKPCLDITPHQLVVGIKVIYGSSNFSYFSNTLFKQVLERLLFICV